MEPGPGNNMAAGLEKDVGAVEWIHVEAGLER